MYWDKNFVNRASYLPGSYGWSSRVTIAMHVYAHVLTIVNVSKFHCTKKFTEKNFSWQKFPLIRYYGCIYMHKKITYPLNRASQ